MADATVGVLKAVLAADTASFTRAMQDASADVQKLAKKLQDDLEPRQRAVNAAVRDFLGGTEIRKAQEYAQAIEKIGGVSVLTAADQQKVNRAVGDALEHYRKLGIEAPANLQKLEAQTRVTEKSTSLLDATWARMTAAFGAATLIDRGITGIINFGKSAIESAGKVKDLSDKTGLSIRAVQVYGQAAEEAGGSLDDMANAVFKLGITLEKADSKSAAAKAIDDLGLSLAAVKALKPEEQFEQIAAKLKAVDSAQERNRLGVDLFGKSWASVAPAVVAGIDDIAGAMSIMGDEQVRALDEAGDAWKRFWDDAKRETASALGEIVIAFQRIKDGLPKLEADVKGMAVGALAGLLSGDGPIDGAMAMHRGYLKSLQEQGQAEAGAAQAKQERDKKTREAAEAAAKAQEEAAKKAKAWANEIQNLATKFSGANIDLEIRKWAAAVSSLKGEIDRGQLPMLVEQLDEWYVSGRKLPPVLDDIRVANNAMAESVRSLNESLMGVFDQNRFNLSDLVNVAEVDWASLSGVNKKPITLTPHPTAEQELQAYLDRMAGRYDHLGKTAEEVAETSKASWRESLSDTADGFEQLAIVSDGAMSDITRNMAIALTSVNQFSKGFDALRQAQNFLQALGPIGQMVSAGIEFGRAIKNLFDRDKGRDLVEDFAKQFGGFDKLRDKLSELGDEGERLWVNLTQGVGSNNTAEAQRAIGDVEVALARLERQADDTGDAVRHIGESGKSWEELQSLAQQFGVDVERLGSAFAQARIDDIAVEYTAAFEAFRKAGADTAAVLEGMQDEVNAWLADALKAGVEIPNSMRPILQSMMEAGLLVDEAGEKIEDLSGLRFAPTLEQGIDNLTHATYALVDVLGGEVPEAFRKMAEEARSASGDVQSSLDSIRAPTLELSYRLPSGYPSFDLPSYDGASVSGDEAYSFASGSRGLRSFSPAGEWAQLHGNEEVLTENQGVGVATMVRDALKSAGGGSFTGNVYLDSRLVGRGLFAPIVREAARQQVTQR